MDPATLDCQNRNL